MYTIAISALIGLLAGGIWTALDLWKGWQMGIVLFLLVGLASFVLISRAVARRIEPRFLAIQKQIQANQIPLAMSQLEGLMPLGRWQILLEGQLHAQLGMLAYATNDDERAEMRHRARLHGLRTLSEHGLLTDSAREHLTLLDALCRGDSQAARAVMDHHLDHVRGIWANRPE